MESGKHNHATALLADRMLEVVPNNYINKAQAPTTGSIMSASTSDISGLCNKIGSIQLQANEL